MKFKLNGKIYNSMHEWAEEQKKDPNSTNIIWEYQSATTIINGKPMDKDGTCGQGKCWYRGKSYEGKIEYKEDGLYVGGELVKPNQEPVKEETMEEKNYETLSLHRQGANVKANVINRLEVHGQGHDIYVKECDEIEVHGTGNQVHREGKYNSIEDVINEDNWDEVSDMLKKKEVYIIDGQDILDCNIPDHILKREYKRRFGSMEGHTDKFLKEELERRGWEVKCTRTKIEEL